MIVRLGGTLGGAVLLFCTAMALLRSGIEEATQALGAAGGRAALAEAQNDSERARMHEIGSTFAGIASASRLISASPVTLPDQKRTSLERMLREEMARLERLLAGQKGTTARVRPRRSPAPPGAQPPGARARRRLDAVRRPGDG